MDTFLFAGFGLFTLVVLAFFGLLLLALLRLLLFGDPEKKRWRALAARQGWKSEQAWRLEGQVDAQHRPLAWKFSGHVDDETGVGEFSWWLHGLESPQGRVHVVTQADYAAARKRAQPMSATEKVVGLAAVLGVVALAVGDGKADHIALGGVDSNWMVDPAIAPVEAGSEHFRQRFVVLASEAALAQRLISPQAEALWMGWPAGTQAGMLPDYLRMDFDDGRLAVTARDRHARMQLEDVERLIKLGLVLAAGTVTNQGLAGRVRRALQ